MSNSSEATVAPITIEDLCLLANSFAEQIQYDKAIQVYESACRLFPNDLALRINLGRVRNLKNQAFDSPADILVSKNRAAASKDIWANRYQGLGEIFLKNARRQEAKQIFEMSRVSNPNFFLPYFNLGSLYLQMGEIGPAIRELEHGRRLNPFHEETVSLLAEAYLEQREYQQALNCLVDALVLSGEVAKKVGPYRTRIKELMKKIAGFTPKMRNDLIRERRDRINSLYEELETELRKVLPPQTEGLEPHRTDVPERVAEAASQAEEVEQEERQRAYDIAVQMKRHLIFRNMNDEEILKIASFTSDMQVQAGDLVYQEGDPVYGLYFINRGKIEVQKATAQGPIVFATFEKGGFFGDDSLLGGRERFTSALAVSESDLLFIDKAGLANIFARERAVAIHFLWYFWKSLSLQIRESNDRMTSFFSVARADGKEEAFSKRKPPGVGRSTHVEIDKKMEVLHAKGLSHKELGHVARLSNEEVYNRGETIFREGDLGDRLFIVLEGTVLISKKIPGVGQEALAVLKKGDFFGEMALVGQHHLRSADASAQDQGTTLLVISREALREILSIDTDSAYQFLTILCRILSQRLLEMNEKIYQWKVMSGSFS